MPKLALKLLAALALLAPVPAIAKQVGIDPGTVTFVNVSPQAKVASLKSHAIDITSDFYNDHDLKLREFGADLGFLQTPRSYAASLRFSAASLPRFTTTSNVT